MSPRFLLALLLIGLAVGGWALLSSWWRKRRLKAFELSVDYVDVGLWTWRYHVSGRGPAMILIHGIGANLYCWRWLIPLLDQRFRVYAVDLPGFGGSSKPNREHYGLDQQCERLLAFMDAMKIEKAYVVGNSMGGNIALWLARLQPHRTLGVAVIAPATNPRLIPIKLAQFGWASAPLSLLLTRPALRWAHRRTVSRKEKVDLARIEESFKTYARKPAAVRSFLRASEAIRDPRLPSELKKIEDPVLLLWGAHDRLVSKSTIDGLESALGAPETHVHETGGHHLQEDEPEWVARKIVEFVERNPDQ